MTDWLALAQFLGEERFRAIEAAKPKMQVGMATGPEDAPGYRYLGCVYFTVPHPLYPWDPAVTRAMRAIVPDFVPMWGRWFFLEEAQDASSSREIYFDRHMIARRVKDPRLSHEEFFGAWGRDARGWARGRPYRAQIVGPRPWPNYLEGHWHYVRSKDLPHPDIPGDFAPYDMEMVRFFEEQRVRPEPGEDLTDTRRASRSWRDRLVERPLARQERREEQAALEQEERREELRRYTDKQREKAGADWDRQVVEGLLKNRNVRFNLGNGRLHTVRLPDPKIPRHLRS